jgi:membrane fusion protein (multidrug efflux system)
MPCRPEELGHARDAVKTAQAALDAAREQAKATDALVGDVLAKQPKCSAASKLKEAWLALQRTEVKAPVSGYVARRNVQVGQRVATGTLLMVVVPLDSVWWMPTSRKYSWPRSVSVRTWN